MTIGMCMQVESYRTTSVPRAFKRVATYHRDLTPNKPCPG
ncbi:hypothetical protein SNOG_08095 [Parastagonospora nodorum SN15]|uniref:Uncharacterized protein n=1 Tax=Phaeosphaeria nodorum (strain SN15 / ATCC MYA-4574 / FGSC 10173) TaxID=321614 RepID=Q0UJG9_PHANO|nr:hypothetical protein SNOG_08095 [Parastagonospora nodorum SN15]EAT84371.1 hypothetical protein SNOG_08095 [Parastagonospora nodorum SN15]